MILLDTIKGKETERPPIWMMRQAGRVLPSYLKIKEKYSFWEMMQKPEVAADVTLLPVNDLGVDAAILFSDILVIPYATGMGLEFTNSGPVFNEFLVEMINPVEALKPDPSKLEYIYDVIDQIMVKKTDDIPLIGFCGAPLTVLCYMLQGSGRRAEFPDAIKYIYQNKAEAKQLIDIITDLSVIYAQGQIEHGVQVFQLFETHAGLLPWDLYRELILPSVIKISNAVRSKGIPFIYFPKGIGTGLTEIDKDICDYVGVDWQIPLHEARIMVPDEVGLQGNMDPRLLFSSKYDIEEKLKYYHIYGREHKDWIFNLGHGLVPDIPFENVKFVVDWLKGQEWR